MEQPSIKDLALIGDRQTTALIDKRGSIVWYCPWRFDQPSLFSLLIDEGGGCWSVEAPGKTFVSRRYFEDSAVLVSDFLTARGPLSVTDFMFLSCGFHGICRMFAPCDAEISTRLLLTPDYNRSPAILTHGKDGKTAICKRFEFYVKASHPLTIQGSTVVLKVPPRQAAWAVLLDDQKAMQSISLQTLQVSLSQTVSRWQHIIDHLLYKGPYEDAVRQSYRAIQLLTHERSGGIVAAATTSLPEEVGNRNNYDYRFVWLRDTAMVVSALVRAGDKGQGAERFLDFLCTARQTNKKDLFVPFYDLDAKTAGDESAVEGTGFKKSKPIRIGNGAYEQFQLDGQGNVLLAAKEIYNKSQNKPHWDTIERTAAYLSKNWRKKDHGIWEEQVKQHFTSSKVIVAKGLEFIAAYATNENQKAKWLNAATEVREFIAVHCKTSDGAYAVYPGSDAVDLAAALYPVWEFDQPDSNVMKKTIARIEAEYREGLLYHRHLEERNALKEGVFLAGSLWMAQYYTMIKELSKARRIIDAVLDLSTDLGFLSEEGDMQNCELLGNIPQTFVHASLIGAVIDYKRAFGE